MPHVDIAYDELPSAIKDNLSPAQWQEAQRDVILGGDPVPDTTQYISLKSGLCRQYRAGEPADGPLLPTHDLSGGGGADDTQFHTAPRGAHTAR
ncbi:MAG TPA: hypothetical protein VK066_21815 [Chloroflexota bacterium]|nr:hypothetical protein [Chloroflexota bacterium]